MTEPQRILKDSVLSVVTIDNFEESVVPERYHYISLPPVAGNQCWFKSIKKTINEIDYLSMFIQIGTDDVKQSVTTAITVKNENSNADFFPVSASWGIPQFIEISQVLAENSGFLRNGALTVQCEVRVDFITDRNGIQKFDFHDPFEGCVRFKKEHGVKMFYASKELFTHHSPMLAEKIAAGEEEFTFSSCSVIEFEWFLQVVHGLSAGQVPEWSLRGIFEYAVEFDTFNVIKRSETIFSEFIIGFAAKFELIRLKRQLKRAKSLEEMKEVVKCGEDRLNLDTMVTVASKFFSFAVDFRGPKSV